MSLAAQRRWIMPKKAGDVPDGIPALVAQVLACRRRVGLTDLAASAQRVDYTPAAGNCICNRPSPRDYRISMASAVPPNWVQERGGGFVHSFKRNECVHPRHVRATNWRNDYLAVHL